MRVLRLTRHPAEVAQLEALKKAFGDDVEVVEHSETVSDATRVFELFVLYRPDVLEAVLPLAILSEVLNPRNGITIPVIRAVMNRQLGNDGTTATFTFQRYERLVKIEVVTEPL